jgi:hypothetical protein
VPQTGIPEADLAAQMTGGDAAIIEKRPGTVFHPISLGGHDALRSVAKSCLVLLATVVGNDAVRSSPFGAACNFVVNGDTVFNKSRIRIDSREIPDVEVLKKGYGEFFNLIYVRSDTNGRTIGHFTLYNIISWQIVLAEGGGPGDQKTALISNPLDPAIWSDTVAAMVDIPFDWLNTQDRAYELERARERFIAVAKRQQEQSMESEISRIVNDVCVEHGVLGDSDVIDSTRQAVIFAEIAARLVAHSADVPYQEPLTPDQIKDLFKP